MKSGILIDKNILEWKMPPGVKKSSQEIEISNLSPDTYIFKIKSTSRSRFVFKPAFGVINSFQKIRVQIVLDLSKLDNQEKNLKDKLAVYSLKAPEESSKEESLDTYIKQNQEKAASLVIISTIEFVSPNVFKTSPPVENVENKKGDQILEKDMIYDSVVGGNQSEDQSKISSMGSSIYTSIIPVSPKPKPIDSLKDSKWQDMSVPQKVGEDQSNSNESDKIQELRKRIFSLEDQLKNTVVF